MSKRNENRPGYKKTKVGWIPDEWEVVRLKDITNHEIGIVSPIYTVFKCNEEIAPEFISALFKTNTYRHIFSISTNASVDRRGSLRWRAFSLIQVPKPSKEEQISIIDVLKAVDNDIIILEKKLKALEKQKRGLMQKLLTGEVRVNIDE